MKRVHGGAPVTPVSWTQNAPLLLTAPPSLQQQEPVTVLFLVHHEPTHQTHLLPVGDTNNCTNIYTVKSLRSEERDQHQGDTQGIGAG